VTSALEQIVSCFGTVGLLSIIAWLVAAGLMFLFVCGLRRTTVCWTALAAAIAGLVLANINSNQISAIQIDFSEEIREAKQRLEEDDGGTEEAAIESDASQEDEAAGQAETVQEGDERETGLQPVPDGAAASPAESQSVGERSEPPGETSTGGSPLVPRGSTPATPDALSRYAYRQQGKVERTGGMEVEDKIPIRSGGEDQPVIANVRVMKMHEVAHANRLDRLNLFFARLTLTLALLLVVVDYFRRFNMTFRSLFPLPVGGPLLDSLFAKTHTVCVGARGKGEWERFLKRVVCKGETFIYFGDHDPCVMHQLGRLPLLPEAVWPLAKITRLAGEREFDDEFLFESAWFGRYCFVILDDGQRAAEMLTALADFLQLRHATRASARHAVNVVWNLPVAPSEPTLKRLAALCRETNFKLLVATDRQLTETQKSCFEEIV
jgi:hypothetical protein